MNRTALLAALVAAGISSPAGGAEIKILLPLGRAAYQTNEWIDVSVVRTSPDGLREGPLVLTLAGPAKSQIDLTFAARAAEGKPAVATEHFHLQGALLRPGKYSLEAAADGATARAEFEVCNHVRKSTFKTIDWASRAAGHEQAVLGPDSMGFNTILYAYGGIDVDEMIRGGLDYMRNCAMGGWHYMDMRRECDWCDPYVLGGGIARASRQAFQDRTNPNCLGVHFYDEPLLAEVKDPADPEGKRLVRYGVPAQERSYKSAFGKDAPRHGAMNFANPEDARRWAEYNHWRLLLLEATWRVAGSAVTAAQPDFVPISQAQWAWQAFDAGYYFNVNRPFPIVSRHALYDYKHGGDFSPSFAFEFGRIRELHKPNWYLPMWGCGRSDLFRAEQYLSFIENLQGIAKPPDLLAHRPGRTPAAQGIVESNHALARLGTIFDTLPVTRSEVAVLYAMSHNLHERTRDSMDSYRGNGHFQRLLALYMASKILHIPLTPVVEEDVLDGTLAAHHKAILVAGVDYLDPEVQGALEAYAAGGGKVLLSDDSRVRIKGATIFPLAPDFVRFVTAMDGWAADKHWDKWSEGVFTNGYFQAARKVAEKLEPALAALGVAPILECDQPGVVVSRQAQGDIEYLFAVNASPDPDAFGWYFLRPVSAMMSLPEGRPVYDALRGGAAEEFHKQGGKFAGKVRFGPGQMRAFARTARPIGGVQVSTPVVVRDYTAAKDPVRVEVQAVLVDDRKEVLCGAAPLRVEVIDPSKAVRYDLYRAADRGVLRLALSLAANDPGGEWMIVVHDLLGNTRGQAAFRYRPPAQCGALAGASRRALTFGRDRDNAFRFFRTFKELMVVKGSSPYHDAAAQRLAKSLAPWDIHCKIVAEADVKRRELTVEEKPTWVDAGGAFDLRAPTVLLGSPDDNALIRHLRDQKFLPYTPVKDQFPGRGRGLIAWQREGLAYFGHESLTLIAHDAEGLNEAVGTAYEIAAGIEPLTPLLPPRAATVRPATEETAPPPAPAVAWETKLPDRLVALRGVPGGLAALSADGTVALLRPDGATAWQKSFDGGENVSLATPSGRRMLPPDAGYVAVGAGRRVLLLDLTGRVVWEAVACPEHGEGVAWVALSDDGTQVLAAANHQVRGKDQWRPCSTLTLFGPKGEKRWSIGGLDDKSGKPAFAERCDAGLFAGDGKKAVVIADKKARILNTADGRSGDTIDAVKAAPFGADVLLTDGEEKVTVYSPLTDKVPGRRTFARGGPVVLAPALGMGGAIIGTESDGTFRLVRVAGGKLEAEDAWQVPDRGRVPKAASPSGDLVAVSYWGGAVRVLDGGGKVRFAQAFAQDVTALEWAGPDRLVVGLADGRVAALALRGQPPR